MLVKCPRCGFSQPQDQYCAQCGVDMMNYRPPQRSAVKKVFGNPFLQIGFVLVVAGAIGSTLYRKSQRDLDDRVRYLQSGPQVARSVSSPGVTNGLADEAPLTDAAAVPAPDNAATVASADAPSGGAAPAAASAEAASVAKAAGEPDPANADAKVTDPNAKSSLPKTTGAFIVRVYYAEVARAGLEQILEESRSTGQFNHFGNYNAGILPSLEKTLSPSNRDVKILHREERGIDQGQSAQWFRGAHPNDPDNEQGLTTFVELTDVDANTYRGNLEILRSWKEGNDGSQKTSFPAVFEIQRGAGFFMTNVLPRRPRPEDTADLVSISPFEIFKSAQYTGFSTDFVVFLEFDRP